MSEYREFKEVTEIKYGSNGIHYSMWKGSPIHVIEYAAYEQLQKQNQLMRDALEKIRDNMHPDGLLYENIFISKDYAYNPAKQTLEKLDELG